ncbi:hypothetical protein BACCIP111899_03071 [Bacillus rhizoplanae]|uniref:Uncharacterized protein n=1 Tax=Bacillus rhizoplanae TaxID=2880966 RepID=A0ABN8A4K5_9BACI|nr:hypothetical protein BACCIP111899_03071 [Bacillus rhizoplanae]
MKKAIMMIVSSVVIFHRVNHEINKTKTRYLEALRISRLYFVLLQIAVVQFFYNMNSSSCVPTPVMLPPSNTRI